MSRLDDALSAVFDEPADTPATPDPAPAAGETPPADASTTPDPATIRPLSEGHPDPETPPAEPAASTRATTQTTTPASPDAVDVEDLKAIKQRFAADHPELQPVLDAALKEMERGLGRKFDQVSAMRKAAEDSLVRNRYADQIPENDLAAFAQLNQLAQTNPAAAADYLWQVSEQLRAQAQNPNPNPNANPYAQLPPQVAAELQQVRQYMHQQTQQQVAQQIEGEFTKLAPEFGNTPIPETQRIHVLETIQARNLGVEDIGTIWRGTYGFEFARQQGLKQGQALRQQKAGLGAGSTAAPPPPSAANKPKNLEEALAEVCSTHGVR